MISKRLRSLVVLAAAIAAAGVATGCDKVDDLLDVQNPGVIGEAALMDTAMIPAMVNSVVGEFQGMFDNLVFAGAILSDEAVNGHNFEQWKQFDLRVVERGNTILGSDVYNPVQRARGSGDDFTARIQTLLGPAASSHFGLARVRAYAGYGYVVLGENFCESPVRPDQPALTSAQILEKAIEHFDAAIATATAAKAAGTAAVPADSIINLARVGAARAYLWIGNKQKAIEYASQVPLAFTKWVPYSATSANPTNTLQAATAAGTSMYLGVDAPFRNLNDPRVRHAATSVRGHNGSTDLWRPFQGPSHSEWTQTGANVAFALGTDIRLASGLEARYIVAEAQGLTIDNLAFVNSRRAVGNQVALLTPTEAEYQAALRDQRRRDFFLDGHRLGDLRRYITQYGVNQFPTGPHPNESWAANYGDATCFIPHNNERVGNPAYR